MKASPRRVNVSLMAAARALPSKSNWRDRDRISKKALMRLFRRPRRTIMWNFSGITISLVEAQTRGAGRSSRVG